MCFGLICWRVVAAALVVPIVREWQQSGTLPVACMFADDELNSLKQAFVYVLSRHENVLDVDALNQNEIIPRKWLEPHSESRWKLVD